MKFQEWQFYVLLAGLSWGVYVPVIFFGGSELGFGRPPSPASRFMAILCVGIAYFLIGVLLPLILFGTGIQKWSNVNVNPNGLVFSGLAGVAGAVGAICVVFATTSAVGEAKAAGLPPSTYKIYIAPLIFGLAPVINVLVSMVWHPQPGKTWMNFDFEMPGWKLVVGIILVGLGAALVLFSKEEKESGPSPAPAVVKPAEEGPKT
jgi:hypothetical protein